MKVWSLCVIVLSCFGAVFGQFQLGAETAAIAIGTDTPTCELTAKALEDIRETKAKIVDVITKLKAYATSIGLEIPTDEPEVVITPEEPTDTTETRPVVFTNCKDILDAGYVTDGVYAVTIEGYDSPVNVYCDMTTDFGGWTVFQRRLDGSVDFNRTFDEYTVGFGNLLGEFWLGNELISTITMTTPMELRIDMSDFDDVSAFAKYNTFRLDGVNKNFRLNVGGYEGTAGNSLGYHHKSLFSTFDSDNDVSPTRNCALIHNGGWWFKNCLRSNLNGVYFPEGFNVSYAEGIEWSRFRGLRYSLKFTEMKIRPVSNEI